MEKTESQAVMWIRIRIKGDLLEMSKKLTKKIKNFVKKGTIILIDDFNFTKSIYHRAFIYIFLIVTNFRRNNLVHKSHLYSWIFTYLDKENNFII